MAKKRKPKRRTTWNPALKASDVAKVFWRLIEATAIILSILTSIKDLSD